MRGSTFLAVWAILLTASLPARADDAAVLAAARRWETPRRVCAAMAKARNGPPIQVARCAREWAGQRLGWHVALGGHDAEAIIGTESFFRIRLVLGAGGRVIRVESMYSEGGI